MNAVTFENKITQIFFHIDEFCKSFNAYLENQSIGRTCCSSRWVC